MFGKSEKKRQDTLLSAITAKTRKIAACSAIAAIALASAFSLGCTEGGETSGSDSETDIIASFWPDAFVAQVYNEPEFNDDANRTNNAFNVIDFGEQGKNGWFYRCGDYRKPQRSERLSMFDGETYRQPGATGLEIKNNFVHTADRVSPILEWRAAQPGKVKVTVSFVKNVNGDANPNYPDGVQLLVYKGTELLKLENVPIYTDKENYAEIVIDDLDVLRHDSLYFAVNPLNNNAYDGGGLYVCITDTNNRQAAPAVTIRPNNNANSVKDFGRQGSNGWMYMYGTEQGGYNLVSHESNGEYIDRTSPSLSIKKDFVHPALNHSAVYAWKPAVEGNVDLRIKYTKFEQHDGNPDFPDGVRLKAYQNGTLLYQQHVDVRDSGDNKVKYRIPSLFVRPSDTLFFVIDPEGNSSYDGGALDVTVIDVNGLENENSVWVKGTDTRQNWADVKYDFGEQGSNGFIFQSGYGDDPFNAYNMQPYNKQDDKYFSDNWLEIKRDYVNTGENDSSAIIKWRVAQDGDIAIRAAYTKMKNEDSNPSWPDGTRVSLYHNHSLLAQQTFAPERFTEVTKRLDVDFVSVKQNDYITLVINGLDNNAYDGGKYEFVIQPLSGLVGETEKTIPATYKGPKENFASVLDDFGEQGENGWYYQYGNNHDPYCAVNIEKYDKSDGRYYTEDGVEIKKDYIVPAGKGKSANVKWVAAQTGVINIDLLYTKLKNEDANPDYPDGVTVYLYHNRELLKERYFPPLTDYEDTGDLSTYGVSVEQGDTITMIVYPGENAAYDGGKYLFVIEDVDKVPTVKPGNNDNSTSLAGLDSIEQGTDGWWFLEGTSPADAKVLTKKTEDGTGYTSRRTEGLVMKKDFVHTGATLDPIYQWVAGEDGSIDISGTYVKYGQEDENPKWPDGVTVKIYKNNKVLLTKKVKVKRGDGNNNSLPFELDDISVKRGDKISFQICADGNNAWDGGQLSAVIEPHEEFEMKPGNDNRTVLVNIDSIEQGTDGWYFMEGTSLDNAKPLTKKTEDGTGYVSLRDTGLEMKKDYVHTGTVQNPIYRWVVAEDGKINVTGSYTKFGQEDSDPNRPDGVTVTIYKNNEVLLKEKVEVKKGDGEDNVLQFSFKDLEVSENDVLSFQISPDNNNAWDAGKLAVSIKDSADDEEVPEDPDRDNNTVLSEAFGKQGSDGWRYGMCDWDGTNFEKLSYDADNNRYMNDGAKPELKADFVEPGSGKNAAYQWTVAQDGVINVKGEYTKFPNSADENADGTTVRFFLNGHEEKWLGANDKYSEDHTVTFNEFYEVKKGDVLTFAVNPEGNDSYDGGRLSVTISDAAAPGGDEEPEDPDRDNNTVLAEAFGKQGSDGWHYGMCDWDSKNFTKLTYDEDNNRYYNNGKPELKADFVEPGNGRNAAYQWTVAQDGTINVKGDYTKFANSEDSNADGTCVRIFVNGAEKKWLGTIGNFSEEQTVSFDETYEVKKGDVITFAVNPEGNDSYDGGMLAVTISDAAAPGGDDEPEDPDRTNNTSLAGSFGEQGNDGWNYGMCDWDSKNFTKLTYDEDNNRYYNNGKPELKADFVEPGNGRNAAYQWTVAQDGTINVKGDYTKFANSEDGNADGTCVRIFVNGAEKKWLGTIGNFADEQTVTFDETYEVSKGDVILFAVNPESNDSYDGGRLSVTISESDSKAGSDTASNSKAKTAKKQKKEELAEEDVITEETSEEEKDPEIEPETEETADEEAEPEKDETQEEPSETVMPETTEPESTEIVETEQEPETEFVPEEAVVEEAPAEEPVQESESEEPEQYPEAEPEEKTEQEG